MRDTCAVALPWHLLLRQKNALTAVIYLNTLSGFLSQVCQGVGRSRVRIPGPTQSFFPSSQPPSNNGPNCLIEGNIHVLQESDSFVAYYIFNS